MAVSIQPPDEQAIEAGRKLFTQACNFVAGAATPDRLPPAGLVEIAFAGPPTVGTPSLTTARSGRNPLARTRRTPAPTRPPTSLAPGGRLRGPATPQGMLLAPQ